MRTNRDAETASQWLTVTRATKEAKGGEIRTKQCVLLYDRVGKFDISQISDCRCSVLVLEYLPDEDVTIAQLYHNNSFGSLLTALSDIRNVCWS